VGLGALQARGARARPAGGHPGLLQGVDKPGDERRLGADDHQTHRFVARRGDQRVDFVHPDVQDAGLARDPRIGGRAQQLGALG
jgi:hypothetical protein